MLVFGVEELQCLGNTLGHGLLSLSDPHSWVEVLLVWLVGTVWVSNHRHQVVLLVQHVVSNTSQVSILTVGVEVDLHHTILDGSVELVVRRSRTTVEDQEQWVLGLCTDLLDGILLVLSQDFWSQDNVTWLVDTVHVTESGSNGEVWRNWSKGFVHGKHSLWLGVQQVLVCALVVDTVLLTTGDTDLHLEPLVQLGHSGELLSTVVCVQDDWDAVNRSNRSDVVSGSNGTGNGSLLSVVLHTLTGEVSGTTVRSLQDDWGVCVSGRLQSSNHGRRRGHVDGRNGKAFLLGVQKQVSDIVTDDNTCLSFQKIQSHCHRADLLHLRVLRQVHVSGVDHEPYQFGVALWVFDQTRDKLAFGVVIVAVELPNVHHNLKLSMELGVRVEIVERVEHLVVVIAVAGPYYQKRIAIAGGLDLCNRAVFCDGEKTVGKA